MTDLTDSTELRAFKRQKDVKELLQKFPCVFVLFYLETNSKSGKIYLFFFTGGKSLFLGADRGGESDWKWVRMLFVPFRNKKKKSDLAGTF